MAAEMEEKACAQTQPHMPHTWGHRKRCLGAGNPTSGPVVTAQQVENLTKFAESVHKLKLASANGNSNVVLTLAEINGLLYGMDVLRISNYGGTEDRVG